MILLLDNVNNLSKKNNERIKYYYDQNYLRSVVFTCIRYSRTRFSDSLKDRIGSRIIKLNPLSEGDAIELIRNRIGNSKLLTDELIIEIFRRSQKNPKKLLENCRILAQEIAKKNRNRIKYIDIIRVLNDKKNGDEND